MLKYNRGMNIVQYDQNQQNIRQNIQQNMPQNMPQNMAQNMAQKIPQNIQQNQKPLFYPPGQSFHTEQWSNDKPYEANKYRFK